MTANTETRRAEDPSIPRGSSSCRCSLPALLVAAICAALSLHVAKPAAPALAQSPKPEHLPSPIEGRWHDKSRGLILDISRCGARFCGVRVVDGKCDRLVLRMDPQPTGDRPLLMALTGQLDLPDEPSLPHANVTVSGQGDNLRLGITGAVGGLAPMSRTMMTRLELSYIGKAGCPAGSTS